MLPGVAVFVYREWECLRGETQPLPRTPPNSPSTSQPPTAADNIILEVSGTTNNLQFATFNGSTQYSITATNFTLAGYGAWAHLCAALNSTGYGFVYLNGQVRVEDEK